MSFSEQLKMLRIEKKLRQEDIAEQIGVKQQTISHYENGTAPTVKIDYLIKLAEFFDVSIDYLIDYKKNPEDTGFPKDIIELLKAYDELPDKQKQNSIDILRLLKDTSEKEV